MDNNNNKKTETHLPNLLITTLISGGLAGLFVDASLHPLDTLKTRLQSSNGFFRSGGFSNLYRGLTPVLIGSAPTSALFFVTYETIKMLLKPMVSENYHSFVHMGAATLGEMVACLIRVPVEVSKQRKQALVQDSGRLSVRLLFRGYGSTVLRDAPFSLIQFTMWEYFKKTWQIYSERELMPFEGAICGALAGGVSAALTTPLDVAKTRIMLAKAQTASRDLKISKVLMKVYRENGIQGCFSGVLPRVLWISLGGYIFFGVYEKSNSLLSWNSDKSENSKM